MKRASLIITYSEMGTCDPNWHGADEGWRTFLASSAGGAWRKEEITILRNPTKQDIVDVIAEASDYSYVMVVFLGEGELGKDRLGLPEMMLKLPDAQVLPERQLTPKCERCTVILDYLDKLTPLEGLGSDEIELHKLGARQLYDDSITQSEKGCVKVYSTGFGKGQGSAFSAGLLRVALQWTQQNKGVLNLAQATELVTDLGPSAPVYRGGRRLRHFPFAIADHIK